MRKQSFVCPKCNSVVENPGGDRRRPTCERGHPLRDAISGFLFVTNGEWKLFGVGALTSASLLIVTVVLNLQHPEQAKVFSRVAAGLICVIAVIYGFLPASRLRRIGAPASRVSRRFSGYGWGLMSPIVFILIGVVMQRMRN
jgi:hypothetical protein